MWFPYHSSLFCLPPPPYLQRPQWNLQRGLVARWDSRRKHSSKQALCRESTSSSKGPALALAKNSSKVIILFSAATSLHSFNHPKISCTTRPWALKKSKKIIGTGIGVGVSTRWFGSWEGRTRWLRAWSGNRRPSTIIVEEPRLRWEIKAREEIEKKKKWDEQCGFGIWKK